MRFDDTASGRVSDVYQAMEEGFASNSPLVNRILAQVLSARGKGARPEFMYRVALLAGGDWETVRQAAVMVEAVHLASLLHDDVVDSSLLRRGTPTLNCRYSDKLSVLFGDYVFLRALSLLAAMGNPEVADVMERAMARMIEGEIADVLSPAEFDEEPYLAVIGNKTASLFSAAGEIGMILAGGDTEARSWARELGECAGMAFQIGDDVIDFCGDAAVTGKPAFTDIRAGCLTLPLIHAFHACGSGARNILADPDCPPESIVKVVRETGGIEYSLARAAEYVRRGRQLLSSRPSGAPRDAVEEFFDSLVNRQW